MKDKMNSKSLLVISIVLLVLVIVFKVLESNAISLNNSKMMRFNGSTPDNDKAYIYLDTIVEEFNDEYTIVEKDKKSYLVKMNGLTIKNHKLDGQTIKLVGVSRAIDENLKNEIVDYNNSDLDEVDEQSLITLNEYSIIFGTSYLDVQEIVDDSTLGNKYHLIAKLFFNFFVVFFVIFVIKVIIDKKSK